MLIEVSHKERRQDRGTLNPYHESTERDNLVISKAKSFIETRFKFKYLGAYFIKGRTISIIEAPSLRAVRMMVKIGTPIFTKLTGEPYEDIRVDEINSDALRTLDKMKEIISA